MGNCISKSKGLKPELTKETSNAIIITNSKYESYNIPEHSQGYGYAISEIKINTENALLVKGYTAKRRS